MTRHTRHGHRSQRDSTGHMRLRDLITALKAQHGSAIALLQRIDPSIIDELRAYAAHRQVDLMDVAGDCLEQLASDAADSVWQLGIERRGDFDDDPEAALLGGILRTAVRARLRREQQIVSNVTVQMVCLTFLRSGHPYTMA